MRRLIIVIFVLISGVAAFCGSLPGQTSEGQTWPDRTAPGPIRELSQTTCRTISVKSSAVIEGDAFTLADLLAPGACPLWREAAASVLLGRAPSRGGMRVLGGEAVRALLNRSLENLRGAFVTIPERVIVRRAEVEASCSDIAKKLFADGVVLVKNSPPPPGGIECGALLGVPVNAPLAVTRRRWDAGLDSWNVSLRCVRPAECLPFVVRVRGYTPRSGTTHSPAASAMRAQNAPLVRPGKVVTLCWEQSGIRLNVPGVCLDAGGIGQKIRVRILGKDRTIDAIVVSATLLRTAS